MWIKVDFKSCINEWVFSMNVTFINLMVKNLLRKIFKMGSRALVKGFPVTVLQTSTGVQFLDDHLVLSEVINNFSYLMIVERTVVGLAHVVRSATRLLFLLDPVEVKVKLRWIFHLIILQMTDFPCYGAVSIRGSLWPEYPHRLYVQSHAALLIYGYLHFYLSNTDCLKF